MKKGQIVKQMATVCLQKTTPIDATPLLPDSLEFYTLRRKGGRSFFSFAPLGATPLLPDSLEFNFVAIKNPPVWGGLIPCYLCVYVIRPHFTAALMMRAEVLFAS